MTKTSYEGFMSFYALSVKMIYHDILKSIRAESLLKPVSESGLRHADLYAKSWYNVRHFHVIRLKIETKSNGQRSVAKKSIINYISRGSKSRSINICQTTGPRGC